MLRMLKGGDGTRRRLALAQELRLAHVAEQLFRANPQVLVLPHEQAELAGQVLVGLVVRRGGKQDALAVILVDVLADGAVPLALWVAQIVALVDDHDAIATQVLQCILHTAEGQHTRPQAVFVLIVFPHRHQILRANDEGLHVVGVLQDSRQGRCHQSLAESHHIPDQHPAPLVEMVRGDLHGGGLKLQQLVAEIARDAELPQAGARLFGEVVRHLDIDVVRRNGRLPGPAFLDDPRKLLADVDAPAIIPAGLEPCAEFFAGVLVNHIDIQFALSRQAGKGEVATPDIAHDGRHWIVPKQQVKLGVQGMPAEDLHDHLAGAELAGEAAETHFIRRGRSADRQLFAEVLGQLPLGAIRLLVVHASVSAIKPHRVLEFFVRSRLHAHQ